MIARKIAGLALATLVVLGGTNVIAQPKGSDKVVSATATATKPDADGKQVVTITLTITDPKFHLYANPVGNEDLKSNQTTIVFPKGIRVKIDYPAGQVEMDKIIGNYKIYEGKAIIKANVQRTKGDTSALLVSIKVQACSKKACLVPATIKLSVP